MGEEEEELGFWEECGRDAKRGASMATNHYHGGEVGGGGAVGGAQRRKGDREEVSVSEVLDNLVVS